MPAINYTGIVDILPRMFDADEKTLQVEAVREHVTVSFFDERNVRVELQMEITSFSIEISFEADLLKNRDRRKWISTFEYECEQWYKTNVRIEEKDRGGRAVLSVNF